MPDGEPPADEIRRRSEELFRLMADAAPVLLRLADVGGHWHFFNKPWLDFTGRTPEQEAGDGWAEGVHADDRQACLDAQRSALRKRRGFRAEYRLRHADGDYRWLLETGTPRLDGQGTLLGYVAAAADVTEQRRAESRRLARQATASVLAESLVRESEARKTAILRAALDAVITIDHEGRVVEWNPAAERTFGFARADVLGEEMARFIVPPAMRDRHRRGLAHYLATAEGSVLGRRVELTALHRRDRVPHRTGDHAASRRAARRCSPARSATSRSARRWRRRGGGGSRSWRRRAGGRTNSWPSSATSCATRSPRCATVYRSCACAAAATASSTRCAT